MQGSELTYRLVAVQAVEARIQALQTGISEAKAGHMSSLLSPLEDNLRILRETSLWLINLKVE